MLEIDKSLIAKDLAVSHVQLPPGEAMTNKADLPALAERHANLGTIKRDHAINLRQLSDKRFTVEVARGCQIRAAGKRAMPDPAGQAGNSPRSSKRLYAQRITALMDEQARCRPRRRADACGRKHRPLRRRSRPTRAIGRSPLRSCARRPSGEQNSRPASPMAHGCTTLDAVTASSLCFACNGRTVPYRLGSWI